MEGQGFGIWDLDLGLGFRTGHGLNNNFHYKGWGLKNAFKVQY